MMVDINIECKFGINFVRIMIEIEIGIFLNVKVYFMNERSVLVE